jgi:hypothetical protein
MPCTGLPTSGYDDQSPLRATSARQLRLQWPAIASLQRQNQPCQRAAVFAIVAYKRSWGENIASRTSTRDQRQKNGSKTKEEGSLMKTDAAVEKLKDSFSTAACKTLRVSHSFHRLGGK